MLARVRVGEVFLQDFRAWKHVGCNRVFRAAEGNPYSDLGILAKKRRIGLGEPETGVEGMLLSHATECPNIWPS